MELLAPLFFVVAILIAGGAMAVEDTITPKGGGYVDTKHPKVGKDYYVVRDDNGKCKIQDGNWGNKPKGALGGAPYANKKYAKKALNKFPECRNTSD
jgi:hypothetical protein